MPVTPLNRSEIVISAVRRIANENLFHTKLTTTWNRSEPYKQGVRALWRGVWHALEASFVAAFVTDTYSRCCTHSKCCRVQPAVTNP